MTQSIALIGAGAMGGAIGTRLLETGSRLAVFDLDPEKVAALVKKGAVASESAADAARDATAVITSLNASKIVGLAAFGKDGICEGAAPGTLIIDMSSIDPEATRKFARMAVEQGLAWVDSPLSGGAPKALIGELTVMMGGDAADVTRAGGLERRGVQHDPYGWGRGRTDHKDHQSGALRTWLSCRG